MCLHACFRTSACVVIVFIYIYNIACVLGVRVQQYFERNPKVN